MGLSVEFKPDESKVYSAYAPICISLFSDENDEDSFRYRIAIQDNDSNTLVTLNQPPDGDSGASIFRIDAILRDYLNTDTYNSIAWVGTSFGTLTNRGKRFKLSCSARYLNSGGVEVIQNIQAKQIVCASLAKPALNSGFDVSESGGELEVNWNVFAPSLDNFYSLNAPRFSTIDDFSLLERVPQDLQLVYQGFGMYDGDQEQTERVVIIVTQPECYRTETKFIGSNPNSAPPGGAELTDGNIQCLQYLFYDTEGSEAFERITLIGTGQPPQITDPTGITDRFVIEYGIGWKNMRADNDIPTQTIEASTSVSLSWHSSTSPTLANQIGPTLYLRKGECETDPRWGAPVVLSYLNRRCAMETLVFTKAKSTTTRMERRQTYARGEGNYVRDSESTSFVQQAGYRRKVLDANYTRSISLTSDWVSEEESILFESLIASPYIFMHDEENQLKHELLCTTTNLTRGELRSDGLINYTINFEFATRDIS